MDESSRPADPFTGALLDGRYRVLEELGAGGMGVVYRAEHVHLHRPVALKVLQHGLRTLPELAKRFEREAQALAALAHPNIVTVLDYGWTSDTAYLAMELLQGKSLQELLAGGPPAPAHAIDIERQLLRGLAFAHARGIVHRDLKPANVFLHSVPGLGETVKILDFGLVKFLDVDSVPGDRTGLTKVGAVYGTPAYMAPEQVAGQPADLRVDVYAAGVVLFEMLAGRRPFEGTAEEMLRKHLVEEVPSLEQVRPDLVITPVLAALLRRALAKDPAVRYPDAAAMLAALEEIPPPAATRTQRSMGEAPTEMAVPASPPRSSGAARRASPRDRRRAIATTAAIAVVLAGIVGLLSWPSPDAEPTRPGSVPTVPTPTAPAPVPAGEAPPAPTPALPSAGPLSRPLPVELEAVRARIDRGERLGNAELRPIYAWFVRHPDDARALLLLAHAYTDAGWNADAVDRYRRAARLDPESRRDPRMLRDLLAIAAQDPQVSGPAGRALRELFAAEAPAALADALARETDETARRRLLRIAAELAP